MSSSKMRGLGGTVLLALLGAMLAGAGLAGAGLAQNRAEPMSDSGPGADLRRNLTTLADNPRSVMALNGAGRATLEMGDSEAALNFFERAIEVEPQNARAKAGMASALVHMERARDALPLFAEALRLGAPEAEIAGDRGLAHDSLGDPRRAQGDYALALRNRDDPELRRRMALSLAISGEREAALRTIDNQLRVRDRAAWRTQAFILALTGDPAGADRTARSTMPAGGAEAMAPFFERLAGLSASQKAMAVHFGRFPSDGRAAAASAALDTRADPAAIALAEGGAPAAPPRPRTRPAEPLTAERRRPDGGDQRVASLIPRRQAELAPAVTREAPPPQPPPEPAPEPPVTETLTQPAEQASAGFTLMPQGAQPDPSAPGQPSSHSRLDAIAALVAALPADEQARAAPARTTEARPAPPTRAASRSRPAPPPHPARHWVQVAGGANRPGLAGTFTRLRERAPALLGTRTAFTTPLNQTNRLLVGPFDSPRAAQAFVNQLADTEIAAFAWTSPAGQEIERLRIANEPRATRSTRSRPEPEQRPAARGKRTR